MPETTKEMVDNLNDLIEILKDGQKGFEAAAEDAEWADLKLIFSRFSEQRAKFADDLQALVAQTGEKPEESGTMTGAIHRGWIHLKSSLTTRDDLAILEQCERGEDSAVEAYRDALGSELGEAHPVVAEQAIEVQAAHDKVRSLRDSFKKVSN